LDEINFKPLGGRIMKSAANIIHGIIIIGITILLFGCGLTQLNSESLGMRDETIVSTYITTTPEKAKLTIVRRMGEEISTAFAPKVVYYALPDYGTHLLVSSPGYRKKIVRLNSYKEKIHVTLEKIIEKDKKCQNLHSLSRAFPTSKSLPDLSYVVSDETQIPELINSALAQDLGAPVAEECRGEDNVADKLVTAVVSIEEFEYTPEAKPYTGKIRIISMPEGAELLLDGYPMGITPIEFPVQSGHHHLVLREERHEIWSGKVTMDENVEKKIKINMVPTATAVVHSKIKDGGNI
jgi:hypothetical protein